MGRATPDGAVRVLRDKGQVPEVRRRHHSAPPATAARTATTPIVIGTPGDEPLSSEVAATGAGFGDAGALGAPDVAGLAAAGLDGAAVRPSSGRITCQGGLLVGGMPQPGRIAN